MEMTRRGLLSGVLGTIGAAKIGISSCSHPKASIQDRLFGSLTQSEADYWMRVAITVDADYFRKRCWNCERGSEAKVDQLTKDYIYVTTHSPVSKV